jgi:alpha-glucosidase
MHDVPIPPGEVQDPVERNVPGLGLGRDPVRTPMQWSDAPNAGFTRARPWLPVSSDHARINVAAQREDPKSMLALYARLIALRRAEPVLRAGRFDLVETGSDVLAYLRDGTFLVALNLGGEPQRVALVRGGSVVVSTRLDRAEERVAGTLELRPNEGLIVRLMNGH